MLVTILIIAALVCFLLDTFGVNARVALTPLGLALLTLTLLV
jgi:hypothetical protein